MTQEASNSGAIELQAVYVENGRIFAAITDGCRNWFPELRSCDLTSFAIFRSAMARRLSIWVDHESQRHADWHERSRAWHLAVANAFKRGAA